MDRLDAMALCVAAVEEGSLAGGARRCGRSPAAVTRAVALLERAAGEPLLLRSTRRLHVTPAGERHLAVWRDILDQLRVLASDQTGDGLSGRVVLTAPELFGQLKVMPVVETFLIQHPAISAQMLLLNRLVDLIGEGVDVAVRLAPLPDSTLHAVRLGEVRTLLCAAPDYLVRRGIPATPGDLESHACIGLNAEGDRELWSFATSPGRARSISVRTRLSVNNAGAAIDAALRGQGVVRVRSYQVGEHLACGRLVRLLPEAEPAATPVSLVFHPERARRGALRAFIDYVTPELRRSFVE